MEKIRTHHHKHKGSVDDKGDEEELLVFGYACKLFRDDEKALLIDSGDHLIPWMGDESLKIDRYDGRGILYDLKPFLPPDRQPLLSAEEKEMEERCDEERYRSLNRNLVDEETYQEEEMKRFYQQTNPYSQVGFNYSSNDNQSGEEVIVPNRPDLDEAQPSPPYVPPSDLNLPSDLALPTTMKHHAIIERTAAFIAQQGPQMEIIMKLKQHGNMQFNFLSHNDLLHPYYKFLLTSIKSGSYAPKEEKHEEENKEREEKPEENKVSEEKKDDDDDTGQDEGEDDEHYLHPSLFASKSTKPPPPVVQPMELIPPEETKLIIETLVRYVARNGPEFEKIIMKRVEPRFSFLLRTSPYNPYYKKELAKAPKNEFKWPPPKVEKKPSPPPVRQPEQNDDSNSSDKPAPKTGTKRKPNPVSFSIKKPKESEGLESSSALPQEDSSDEDDSSNQGEVIVVGSSSPELSPESVIESVRQSPKRRTKEEADLQKERKLKLAQFLKGLKEKQS